MRERCLKTIYELAQRDERVVFLGPPHGEVTLRKALRRQAEAFLDSVRMGMPAGASVDDAVAALEWAERATESARTDL